MGLGFASVAVVHRLSFRTMAILMTTTAMAASSVAMPAMAQAQQPVQASAAGVRHFDIPTQPLATAINAFGRQSGLQVTAEADVTAGVQAQAVSGDYQPVEALSRLLTGSGVTWRMAGDNIIVLTKAPQTASDAIQLGPVRVQGTVQAANNSLPPQAQLGNLPSVYAGGQTARGSRLGLLGNTDVMDAPFNVTSYTSDFMENRQTVTLADVLTKDSSVRFTGQIGGVTDSFFIRGFPIGEGNTGEIAFDGVYGVAGNYHVFTTYVERAEVLKGPGALLYGMSPNSGVGGVVNIVPKRSLPEDLLRVTADYGSDSQGGGQLDLSRRFGKNREWGIRVNLLHRQGARRWIINPRGPI